MAAAVTLLLDSNVLIDVLQGRRAALDWLEAQERAAISVISWIEVLVGSEPDQLEPVRSWLWFAASSLV